MRAMGSEIHHRVGGVQVRSGMLMKQSLEPRMIRTGQAAGVS